MKTGGAATARAAAMLAQKFYFQALVCNLLWWGIVFVSTRRSVTHDLVKIWLRYLSAF